MAQLSKYVPINALRETRAKLKILAAERESTITHELKLLVDKEFGKRNVATPDVSRISSTR